MAYNSKNPIREKKCINKMSDEGSNTDPSACKTAT